MGRNRCLITQHHIDYLVLCYGVPLKILNDPTLFDPGFGKNLEAGLRTNAASVDTEIALLASQKQQPIMGFIDNPLFKADKPISLKANAVIKVARLDGPDPQSVRQLIDSALTGEQQGLMGRAYIDRGGPYEAGDTWLEQVERSLQAAGFDTEIEKTQAMFSPTARCDSPAWYFGWYSRDIQGPFQLPEYRFAPGAIAVHLHSFAAETLRHTNQRWCAPLVARGAAATLGHVNEPYLALAHRLDLFVERLLAGDTLGEATYYALPVLSWQAVLIGDPLYQPSKVSLEQQLKQFEQQSFSRYNQYAVLRRMHLLDQDGNSDAALALGERLSFKVPGAAISLDLSRRYHRAGHFGKALASLRPFAQLPYFPSNYWRICQTIADKLIEYGDPNNGLKLYQKLIDSAESSPIMLKHLLQNGIKHNLALGRLTRAAKWEQQLQSLLTETAAKTE